MEAEAASTTAAAIADRALVPPAPDPAAVSGQRPAERPPVLGHAVPLTFAQARQR